jgi:hypothetical protein
MSLRVLVCFVYFEIKKAIVFSAQRLNAPSLLFSAVSHDCERFDGPLDAGSKWRKVASMACVKYENGKDGT